MLKLDRFWITSGLALILLLAHPCLMGQAATGTPPFSTSIQVPEGALDVANNNVHIPIGVIDKAGREMPFYYTLSYDSLIWYPSSVSGTNTWTPVANWGWHGETEVATGYISYRTNLDSCSYFSGGRLYKLYFNSYTSWVYHDTFGIAHSFSFAYIIGNPPSQCNLGSVYKYTETATTPDGSGYTMTATATPSAQIVARDGSNENPPLQSSSGAGTAIDRNGNEISASDSSGTTTFTDTLGTSVLTASGLGTQASPLIYSWTNPSNNPSSIQVNYTNQIVRTNFGCSGVVEYYNASVPLVSSIILPDGASYAFSYEPTPGYSGGVTGRLASITLPAGGTIYYNYSGGSNGINCADGSTPTLTRTTPDSTIPWTYVEGSSVTDPEGNQTTYQFSGLYQTEMDAYQGSSGTGTLKTTVYTCYNGAAWPCNGGSVSLPITQISHTTKLPNGSSFLESQVSTTYNDYGLPTEIDNYDFGSGNVGALLRKTLISYASLGNNIVDLPSQVTVDNAGGTAVAETQYAYDQTSVVGTSGTPQHVSISGARGNLTTVTYSTSSSTTLSRAYTYFDTGLVDTETDVNGAQTSFTYGDCGNSFPTTIALPQSLNETLAWNCTGGVVTSVAGPNGNATSYGYSDPHYWRLTSVTDPEGNDTQISYAINPITVENSLSFNAGGSVSDTRTTLDGLGRVHIVQRLIGSSNYDSTETDYDADGLPDRITSPYEGAAGATNSSGPATTITYDALGRPSVVQNPAGGSVNYTYTANDVLRVLTPAPSGENAKERQWEYNGLGELTSVCEMTSSLSGYGTCGQTVNQHGYWTKYSYDPLGDLTQTIENAQSSTTETRNFSYDELGRLISESNPESGTTAYTYDTDGTCGTSDGDRVKKIDNLSNVTCYGYDGLHRVTAVTYPSGTYASVTPNKYFVYDSATVDGAAMANAKGRLAEAYTGSSGSKLTDEGFSYTPDGQVANDYEATPNSAGYYDVNATYWANGVLDGLNTPGSVPSLTYHPDAAGRIAAVSAASGQSPISDVVYNDPYFGEVSSLTYGSGDSDSFSYNASTGLPTQYQFAVNGQTDTGSLGWNANGTLGTLDITDNLNSSDTQNCSYAYDDLGRVASINCGSLGTQSYSLDPFGNLSATGDGDFLSFSSIFNTQNQIEQWSSSTPNYDGDGNLTSEPFHTFAWDADGNLITVDNTIDITYDALDRAVEDNLNGHTQIVYSPLGGKLALMNGQTLSQAFIPLPGGAEAVYNNSGLDYYRHPDWLGSSRLASTSGRGLYFDTAYSPYGNPYAATTGTPDYDFTGQNADTVNSGSEILYDYLFRDLSPLQGRWLSPDPIGLGAVNPGNPQSWNRYSYVNNNPLNSMDLFGLNHCVGPAASCAPPNINGNEPNPIMWGTDFLWGWIYTSALPGQTYFGDGYSISVDPYAYWGIVGVGYYGIPGYGDSISYGPSGPSNSNVITPQTPTPQKKPCTELQNQAKEMTQLAEADHAVEGPLLFSLFPAGSAAVLGGMGTATGYACGVPEPGWIFACGGMVAIDIVGGGAIVVGNYFYFKNAGPIWKKLTSPASPPSGPGICGGG